MKHPKRRAIAYIVASIISEKNLNSIFDYIDSSYYNFGGEITLNLNIYDYSRSNYLSGNINSIYDYSTCNYITLDIENDNFSGYDYETSNYFNGQFNGNSISFYDYETGTHYSFSI